MWTKKMSRTEAMQPTQGWPVPYMRFTKGRNAQDNQTWFKNTLFGNQNWSQGTFGQHVVEQCIVPIEVKILGINKGVRNFLVTHDPNRMLNNNTPNTWLHYDNETIIDFSQVNLTDREFKISVENGSILIEIS